MRNNFCLILENQSMSILCEAVLSRFGEQFKKSLNSVQIEETNDLYSRYWSGVLPVWPVLQLNRPRINQLLTKTDWTHFFRLKWLALLTIVRLMTLLEKMSSISCSKNLVNLYFFVLQYLKNKLCLYNCSTGKKLLIWDDKLLFSDQTALFSRKSRFETQKILNFKNFIFLRIFS